MAKRKKYKSSKCPEPLNTLIDIAGAAALGAYTRHKILSDYKRGQGESSVKAAMLVHGAGAMRRGSDGLVSLGGVYGINSALEEIERQERKPTVRHYVDEPDIPIAPITSNNNRYAWRLNCEDGSEYGISPYDYETRPEYNAALNRARGGKHDEPYRAAEEEPQDDKTAGTLDTYCLCRVSRLDNGQNAYFLTDEKYPIGCQVIIPTEGGAAIGVVLSYEEHTEVTIPVSPEDLLSIIGKA